MRHAEILWPPHPYQAGFCITDDTDAATLAGVRAVYDFLASIGLRTTKTVWAFEPSESCGIPALPPSILRGVTLEDRDYFRYCQTLRERGFEICLHGASAGNNVRERTTAALELIEREFGGAGTYICHAKNAENMYWHEKVAPRGPARWALAPLSRYRCSGEDPTSPYYWGDVCLEKVRHIRLFRTREINTLARNPSMPYFDPEKPLVRGWFAATKRSFHDCTSPAALEHLRRDHGLCVLYQYLHRYADPETGGVDETFRADAERLVRATGMLVDTTSRMMDRLRLIQGVFLAQRNRELWVVNANDQAVEELQVRVPSRVRPSGVPGIVQSGEIVRIERIERGRAVGIETETPVTIPDDRAIMLEPTGRGTRSFGFGRVFLNVGEARWTAAAGNTVAPGGCHVEFDPTVRHVMPLAKASTAEIYALLAGQLGIIAHEVVWKGRSVNTKKFLGRNRIALEDHSNW